MAKLAQVLKSFQGGSLSQRELFVELEKILNDDRADVPGLLAVLAQAHASEPLPDEIHDTLQKRIKAAAGEKRKATLAEIDSVPADPDALTEIGGYGQTPVPPAQDTPAATTERPPVPAPGAADRVVGVGDVLNDRFVLEERVGAGGMSAVFRALDRRRLEADDRNPYVAVKVLNVEFRTHPQSLIALQREAKKSQSLAHPNIVRVYDFDRDGATVYMTMEYLSGRSLAQILEAPDFKGMPAEQALSVLEGMSNALRFAHENGIVHADFKPANVFITDSGQVKVIDFGIARAFQRPDQADMGKTRFDPGSLFALTPPYASPEMLEFGETDPRDDIYALACTAYEMLTGLHPFGWMPAIQARSRGIAVERRPGLTQRQWKALKGALAFDRERRTPTVAQFCEDMRATEMTLPVPAALGMAMVLLAAAAIGFLYFGADKDEVPAAGDAGPPAPPVADAEPAAALAAEVAREAFVPGEQFRDCPWCPQMVAVPPGTFLQGSPASERGRFDNEGPQRPVNIDYPLAVGQYEVTVEEFGRFVADTGYQSNGCWVYKESWTEAADRNWSSPGFEQGKNHPASCVSWDDAKAYLRWLSENTGKRYRLLSASEWEYVARANNEKSRVWEDDTAAACRAANVADLDAGKRYSGWQVHACDDGYVHTAPVGSYQPNKFGLHDVLGNVFEWVEDCWHDSYQGAPGDGQSWTDGDCTRRVLRGGSWFSMPDYVRSAFRNRFDPKYRSSSFGFRVARVIER